MCVYVFQCVFVCGCQKASNKKLLDHNFSSPLTMPKNMQQQSTGGATSLSYVTITVHQRFAFLTKQLGFDL